MKHFTHKCRKCQSKQTGCRRCHSCGHYPRHSNDLCQACWKDVIVCARKAIRELGDVPKSRKLKKLLEHKEHELSGTRLDRKARRLRDKHCSWVRRARRLPSV